MAMQDTILFTGKELNLEIPKFSEMNAASERLRLKLNREEDAQKDLQKELRANTNVDIETFTSNHAMKQQAEMAKAFTDKWTLRAKERGNKLTNDDLMEQRADAIGMATRQKEWLSSQKQWEMDAALIKQRAQDYDVDKFKADTDAYVKTGVYNPNSLEYSGINMADYFNTEKWVSPVKGSAQKMASQGGRDIYTTVNYNTTPELAKQHIAQTILNDPTGRRLKGVMKDFQKEDDSVKMQYLDTNNNGVIEPEKGENVKVSDRNILNNPIMKYAQDKYFSDVYRQDIDTKEKRTPSTAGGSSAGVLGKMQPLMERDNIPLGSSNYPQYYGALTSSKKIDIPMKGGRVLVPKEQNAKGETVGGDYDLPRDKSVQGLDFVAVAKNANGKIELIFRLPSANWSQIEEDAGTNLAFPLEENPEFLDVPLKDAEGKAFTARSLIGITGTGKKKAY